MTQHCIICLSTSIDRVEYRNTWSSVFQNKAVLFCRDCGQGWMYPAVDEETIIRFYQTDYRSEVSPHYVDFSSKILSPKFYRAKSIAQLLLAQQYLTPKRAYNILDFGAGLGRLFISASELFDEQINLYAIEHDKNAIKYFRKYHRDVNILNSVSECPDGLDLVVMSHSLEHFDISGAKCVLKEIYEALIPGGILLIEVPHCDFRDAEYQGIRPLDTPHLTFFSLKSLQLFLEGTEFSIKFIDTAGPLIDDLKLRRDPFKTHRYGRLKSMVLRSTAVRAVRRFKRNLLLEKESKSRLLDGLYRSPAFKYRGRRQVIRCILQKQIKKVD